MSFGAPAFLLALLLVPAALAAQVASRRRARRYAVRFTGVAALKAAGGAVPAWRRWLPGALLLGALAVLALALAKPQKSIAVPKKQPCSSATLKARFAIGLWRTTSCVPVCKGNDVSRAIRFWRGNEKHCRVAGAFADGVVVCLVANPFHSATGNRGAAHGRAIAFHIGRSRSRPRRPGFRGNVRRDL